jgi:hypothetical protein
MSIHKRLNLTIQEETYLMLVEQAGSVRRLGVQVDKLVSDEDKRRKRKFLQVEYDVQMLGKKVDRMMDLGGRVTQLEGDIYNLCDYIGKLENRLVAADLIKPGWSDDDD